MVAQSSRSGGDSDADSATIRPCATMSCATVSRGASSGQGRPVVGHNIPSFVQNRCRAHATGSNAQQKRIYDDSIMLDT